MSASHDSLRDDFEVSCEELDVLVRVANDQPGVLGSRMTGGGFGGCTVTLVRKQAINAVIERMRSEYGRRCAGQEASFYVCAPSQGARLLDARILRGENEWMNSCDFLRISVKMEDATFARGRRSGSINIINHTNQQYIGACLCRRCFSIFQVSARESPAREKFYKCTKASSVWGSTTFAQNTTQCTIRYIIYISYDGNRSSRRAKILSKSIGWQSIDNISFDSMQSTQRYEYDRCGFLAPSFIDFHKDGYIIKCMIKYNSPTDCEGFVRLWQQSLGFSITFLLWYIVTKIHP